MKEDNSMEKFVPFEKMSKKQQDEINKSKRGSWNGMNPVTRAPETPKAYNREKEKRQHMDDID